MANPAAAPASPIQYQRYYATPSPTLSTVSSTAAKDPAAALPPTDPTAAAAPPSGAFEVVETLRVPALVPGRSRSRSRSLFSFHSSRSSSPSPGLGGGAVPEAIPAAMPSASPVVAEGEEEEEGEEGERTGGGGDDRWWRRQRQRSKRGHAQSVSAVAVMPALLVLAAELFTPAKNAAEGRDRETQIETER